MGNVQTKNCKSCNSVISGSAALCPHCRSPQKFSLGQSLGHSIPLIAATVSTLLLVGTLIWPLVFPERAQIKVQPAAPRYALDELRLDITNLSDLAVLIPANFLCKILSSSSAEEGSYSAFEFHRSPESAAGLRNESRRITFEHAPLDGVGAQGTKGELSCSLLLEDRFGVIPDAPQKVAFEVHDESLILYNFTGFDEEYFFLDAALGVAYFGLFGPEVPASVPVPENPSQD